MAASEFDAFLTDLDANTPAALRVVDHVLRDETGKLITDTYLVVFGGTPDELDDQRFSAPQRPGSRATYTFTVRAVSPEPAAVRAAVKALINAMVGRTLAVDGRRCDPLRVGPVDQPRDDDSVAPPLFYADAELELTSYPA